MFCKQLPKPILKQGLCSNSKRVFGNRIRTYEEVRIPVPWGHIAGKWWGPQNKRPILAIHGWQDNCGSFDLLIPQLQLDVGVLAIDCPGHGLSSHFPLGMYYHSIDSVVNIRRLVQYFNWEKVSFLGHSMGAIVSYMYSTLYPDTVDFLICLDLLKPLVFENDKINRTVKHVQNFLKYDERVRKDYEPNCYTLEQMKIMLHEISRKSIHLENTKYILERHIAPSKKEANKYYITRDIRSKAGVLLGMPQEDNIENATKATFPLLWLKFRDSSYIEKKELTLEVANIIKKHNKNFEQHMIQGTHHAHLNNPERVSGLISDFIKKYNVCDRSKGGIKEEMISERTG